MGWLDYYYLWFNELVVSMYMPVYGFYGLSGYMI